MTSWTKESALKEINALVDAIDHLKELSRNSAEHVRWLARTTTFLEEVFGRDSAYWENFAALPWQNTGTFAIRGIDIERGIEQAHQRAYVRQLDQAKGLLQAAGDQLVRSSSISDVYKGKDTAPESSLILKVINLAEHKLRKMIRAEPAKEHEIQEAFENLLIGADVPYSRETRSIEYSSKTQRPDFTIEKIDLVIELKLCARDTREKELISEINDDILAYRTEYGNLLFIIYDVGQIRDVDRFSKSFEAHENVIVRVVKH